MVKLSFAPRRHGKFLIIVRPKSGVFAVENPVTKRVRKASKSVKKCWKSKSTLDSVAWSNVEQRSGREERGGKEVKSKVAEKKIGSQADPRRPIFRPSVIFGFSPQSTVTRKVPFSPQNPTQWSLGFPVYCLWCTSPTVYCRRG